MKPPVVVMGVGQMGSVFAQGFLQALHPVYPIEKGMEFSIEASEIPDPAFVLVAVREEDLSGVLEILPGPWRGRLGLLQNELLPRDWEIHGIPHPTVVAVWFEKRKGRMPEPYFPSPIYGEHADWIENAMQALGLPTTIVSGAEEMVYELVRKNLYIVSKNIAGLVGKGNIGELWQNERELFLQVAEEIFKVQSWLTQRALPRERLFAQLAVDIERLPEKGTAGGSARARLARAIRYADEAGLTVPRLRAIWASTGD